MDLFVPNSDTVVKRAVIISLKGTREPTLKPPSKYSLAHLMALLPTYVLVQKWLAKEAALFEIPKYSL